MKLTPQARAHIKPSNFAVPGGHYPVEDPSHAKAALFDVAKYGTPEQKAQVRAKVASKFPSLYGNK